MTSESTLIKSEHIRSLAMKRSWKEGKIEPNANFVNESREETELRADCVRLFPDENVRKTTLRFGEKWIYPDIRIGDKMIVEFFGDFWHGNPELYSHDDIVEYPGERKILISDIWEIDKKRIDTLSENGYTIFIVWQSVYRRDRDLVLNRIVKWYDMYKTVNG